MADTNLEIIEVKNLVPVTYIEREKFFLNENNEVQVVIDAVKNYYSNITFDGMDGNTDIGRKAIKKIAAELNNKIKEIDNIGKSVTDILKAKPKRIDAGRKLIRDSLTGLYEEIRKPVVEFEAEQARLAAEEQAKIEAERLAEQEELARLRAEKEQQEREARIAEQAANQARIDAENKAREAQLALQREREESTRKEQERIAAEQLLKDEEARRQADVEHRKVINNQALSDFKNFGIDEDVAKDVIKLIIANKISNIFIKY